MKSLNVAVAQFQPKDGDKNYNLSVIDNLTKKANEILMKIIEKYPKHPLTKKAKDMLEIEDL